MPAGSPRKPPKAVPTEGKLSAAVLRKLARGHTEDAVAALAAIAVHGASEASRIAAAIALLDRGYGKSRAGVVPQGSAHPPILYHWIELIDGTEDPTRPGHPARQDKAGNGQIDHQD